MKKIRCAVYTRKSSEDGLEQEFNSLHAQRDACSAYIASQKHEGWVMLPDAFDDGGLSGGSLERPALQRLMEHVREGRVDQIVVYKIDRLTRSLADFAKIVDVLDEAGASFVSVTQSFNTATSMGRLTLNMLLSFAQFEREVTAERIRDKIAASKRKGLWMGGQVPMGYDPDGRTLKINQAEAATIRTLYDLYERLGTVRAVKEEANRLGLRSRRRKTTSGQVTGGTPFDRGHIHHILTNPIYAGRIRHRDKVFDGAHPAIIEPDSWDKVQAQLQAGAARSRRSSTARRKSLLCGKLFDETGDRLTPSHSKTRKGVRLRYYISHRLVAQAGEAHSDTWRLPAEEFETKVGKLVQMMLAKHGFAAKLVRGASADAIGRHAATLAAHAADADPTMLLGLVDRIDIMPGQLDLRLDAGTLAELLGIDPDDLDQTRLDRSFPFQLRKRGVETKIILNDAPSGTDDTLIRNIAKAHAWFERIKEGETVSEIAAKEATSKRRIQQLVGLAFLAPDIVRDTLEGRQPIGFTSEWCLRHDLPSDWSEQRQLLATL
ncbi:recombinase family protein [Roseovarius sp. SK2]|uniref:recombinase family protein n=1 Tax=Roseovarius TaxID=74030 RepID=UPI00237B64D8|nr:recombinase family protein [Roseovarius sp. SK2]MDD9724537.1 recombinase family protein [Roseovarius sp. SK2]